MITLSLISAAILLIWFMAIRYRSGQARAIGESVYLDRGRQTRVLISQTFGIRAKPDSIERGANNTYTLVELKNRAAPVIYPSDRAQIIASVLAARESGYPVERAVLEIRSGRRLEVALRDDANELAGMISKPLKAARLVAQGRSPGALPAKGKCATCGYRSQCIFKA